MLRKDIKKRPLATKILDSLEPEAKDYRELDGHGLYFLVKQTGSKSWQYRYKNGSGQWAWLSIGPYPKVSAKLARQKAQEFNVTLSNGETLITKKILAKEQEYLQQQCFEYLINEWLDTKSKTWGKTTFEKAVKSINKHLIPHFGPRNYHDIAPKEWFDFFQGLQRNLGLDIMLRSKIDYFYIVVICLKY